MLVALAALPATLAFQAPALGGLGLRSQGAALSTRPSTLQASRAQGSALLSLRAKEEFAEGAVAGGFSNKGEPPVQIRGFSLANVVLGLGVGITVWSFYNYFTNQNSISSLGFVYGLPIALGGFALKYAEILPVELESTEALEALFEEKANPTLKKVREDVTRHRYGDDAHLDTSLEKLGLVMPGKGFPEMQKITLSKEKGGQLGFTMMFQSKDTPYKVWADPARIRRYETFFGPDVNAEIIKVSKEERLVSIKLTTGPSQRGSGAVGNDALTVGGAVKMEDTAATEEGAPEEKRSMEV